MEVTSECAPYDLAVTHLGALYRIAMDVKEMLEVKAIGELWTAEECKLYGRCVEVLRGVKT